MTSRRLVVIACLAAVCSAKAQLFIDAGGPRDIFYDAPANTNRLAGFYGSIATATPSLSLDYFHRFGGSNTPPALKGIMAAGLLKVSAVDGLAQFFKFDRWPQTDLSLLVNKTWQVDPSLISLTVRPTLTVVQQAIFDKNLPIGSQLYKKTFVGWQLDETISALLPWGDGVALTIGEKGTSNYEDLQKTTVGQLTATYPLPSGKTLGTLSNGQTVRKGSWNGYNQFPITLLYSRGWDFLDTVLHWKGVNWLPGLDKKGEVGYRLLTSPYGTFAPGDEGEPSHLAGVNFVLEALDRSGNKDGMSPNKEKLSFPLGIFVERKNIFAGKPATTVGAAVIYQFK